MKINYYKLVLVNYLFILILEFIFKFFVFQTFDIGVLYILIFSFPVAVFISFISSLFKNNKVNRILSIFVWLAITIIFIAELIYNSFYKSIFGISALGVADQAADFAGTIVGHAIQLAPVIISLFIPFIILLILSIRKNIEHEKFNFKYTIVLFISTYLMGITSLQYKTNLAPEAYDLYFNTKEIFQSTNEFGLMNGLVLDTTKTLVKFEEVVEEIEVKEFTKEENTLYNIQNIDFESLIANETDSTVINMHKYFESQEPTKQNDYTGIFAGKNLIFITAEGFSYLAVDPELTPTLYKMANSGLIFDHYYQPIWSCSTSDGEFSNMLSIIPGVSTCSYRSATNTYLPYQFGLSFKDYNYNTLAFHGWTYTYYNRDEIYPNLGYTYYGYDRYHTHYKYALEGIHDSWPTSDVDVVNAMYPYLQNEDRYVAYMMSISGHLEYSFSGNDISKKNKSLVSNMNASNSIKAYMAANIEFDKSMELLLQKLEEDGKINDTVIVIAADHYPYGLTYEEIKAYDPTVQNKTFDLYKNQLIIYNPELKETHITKNIYSIDVLPTILNMFGISYDSRLLMGKDIMSDSSDLVIFNDKSWITDKGRYDYIKKSFEKTTDEELPSNYVQEINDIVNMKMQMSKLIISKDYYRKVLGK